MAAKNSAKRNVAMTLHVRRVDSFHRVVLFPFRFVTTFRLQEGQNTVVGWSRRTSLTSWNVFARGFGGGRAKQRCFQTRERHSLARGRRMKAGDPLQTGRKPGYRMQRCCSFKGEGKNNDTESLPDTTTEHEFCIVHTLSRTAGMSLRRSLIRTGPSGNKREFRIGNTP